nr:uncharacterized protein LOC111504369 [Leptinotarsa decemlineata]
MGFKLLICLLLMFMKVSENKNLPADFPRCHRSDQFLNKCMLQAMETVRPFIAKGIPEINLPPFEPLFVKGFEVDRDTEALRIKANLTNVFVHGLTNYDCRTFEFRVPSLQFATRCSFKEVKLVSDYTISGSVLGAQIEGTGNLTAIFVYPYPTYTVITYIQCLLF